MHTPSVRAVAASVLLSVATSSLPAQPASQRALPPAECEGCGAWDAPAALSWDARIAPPGEPGVPLVVSGTVYLPGGRVTAAGVLIYAYHTDATGRYPGGANGTGHARNHGRLRGFARTDANGRYRFTTIRPAPYPGRADPAHIHVTVTPPGGEERWIDDVEFDDDPLLTSEQRARRKRLGGSGIVRVTRDARGVLHTRRDIVLEVGPPAGTPRPDGARQVARVTSARDSLPVDVARSILRWKGTKFRGRGSHAGTVRLQSGALALCSGAPCGGTFTVDLRTIAVTDIPEHDPIPRERLRRHLESDHFFDVARYPTARFTLGRVVPGRDGRYDVQGTLTLRGVTRALVFTASHAARGAHGLVTATVVFDRHLFGISYRDPIREQVVDDDITLVLEIVFPSGAGKSAGD